MSDIRLYMFACGSLKTVTCSIKMNQGHDPYEIPVPWFLITHPRGNVVIDGGNAAEVAEDARKHWGAIVDVYQPVMRPDEACVPALEKIGIDPASVKYVLNSHLHLDHTGAIGRFANATHIVQRAEYEYAFTPDWFAAGGYIRADFDKPGLKWQFLEGLSTDFYDLYGDGVIKMIFTPGHAPGHQSFLITLPESGPILLTIDAAYTTDHWNERALPGFLASTVDTVRSVRKMRALVEQTGAKIVTGHDPITWPTFKQAPAFYG
jgi:glyoxylase-like metal-dependent hydrolase (beta-lactamase superfamily II)